MEGLSKALVFTAGNEEYGIPIPNVISIEKFENITPIPQLPGFVKGVAKVRDELIPAIDFENVLYGHQLDIGGSSRIIVLDIQSFVYGLLVKDAKEIIDISEHQLKQIGLIAYQKTSYLSGIANLDSRLITMVDTEKFIEALDGIKEIKHYMSEYRAEQEV
ncbi:chemotaxis protein CheW [Heyndrickxia acidicola]|uniref:Chemotaxis protein CheW n=1 Tax=Heyndrickxia acidicola TaxID=209389 RepID=A0ABU6MKN9_9BACI|nr:chemotaxis protein CheW [Heyndrickxia acidicola]MED1205240.1 chemotaxis protein CheW [Heyndrickxia acidicola]